MAVRYVQKHQPLITPRIEFGAGPPHPLPLLTSRIEFDPQSLARARISSDTDRQERNDKRRRLSTSGRYDRDDSDASSDDDPPTQTPTAGPSTLKTKPPGEPGKPGSGGYSLENVLLNVHKWQKKDYEALYVRCHFFNMLHISDMVTGGGQR